MGYQIGDKVIHCTYGLGEVVDFQERNIHGEATHCYVVEIGASTLQIWVPINDLQQQTLRRPMPPEEFERLAVILTGPGEPLPEDRVLRRNQLLDQMRDGQLASICSVVRDLTHYKRSKKLNEQESALLERAINSLLTEWSYSQEIAPEAARQALEKLLNPGV